MHVGEQVMGEQHRLGVLQVGHAGHRGAAVPLGQPDQGGLQLGHRRRDLRAASRRYSRRSVATWSLRLRPARSLPPRAPSRSSRPRSSAVCTSSSSTVGRNEPAATAASRSSSAADHPAQLGVVEQPGAVQHPGVRPRGRRSYGASRQSKCTLTESRGERLARPAAEPAAPQPRRCRAGVAHASIFLRHGRSVPRGSPRPAMPPSRWSRRAAILLGRPHSSTKPLASVWSNVSPESYVAISYSYSDDSLRRPVTTARPACSVSRTSPDTCALASSTNPSSARFSGENHRPS